MRRFASFVLCVFSIALPAAACDGPVGGSPSVLEAPVSAPMPSEVAGAPGLLAECHAAYNDAAAAVEAARVEAAGCAVDADCTVAVAETRCTGEVDAAVSVAGEEAFLDRVDRVDGRVCAAVDATCASAGADEPAARAASCVAGRCELAGE